MKKFLALFFVVISFASLAQDDRLIFKDGYNWPCTITSVENGIITFIRKNDRVETIKTDFLIEFLRDGKWYEVSENELIESESSITLLKPSVFIRQPKHEVGKWSLGTNPVAPIAHFDADALPSEYYRWDDDGRALFQHFNRNICLEPEYRISNNFSILAPLRMGFQFKAPTDLVHIADAPNSSYSDYSVFADTYNYYSDINDVKSITISTRTGLSAGHNRSLLFQGGLAPKFYPFGQSQVAFYMSAGAFVGLHDLYQIDYYFDFDYTLEGTPPYQYYNIFLTHERAERTPARQLYFKWELSLGLEFNLHKNFSLGLEALYSSHLIAGGVVDNYYGRYKSDPYELLNTLRYNKGNGGLGYTLGRVHLIYRFTKGKDKKGDSNG